MDEIKEVEDAAAELIPAAVLRHREAGVLTWALLHQIESEVLDEIVASGEHRKVIVNMIRAAPAMGFPRDDRPVSLTGHDILPILFDDIIDCWNRTH